MIFKVFSNLNYSMILRSEHAAALGTGSDLASPNLTMNINGRGCFGRQRSDQHALGRAGRIQKSNRSGGKR